MNIKNILAVGALFFSAFLALPTTTLADFPLFTPPSPTPNWDIAYTMGDTLVTEGNIVTPSTTGTYAFPDALRTVYGELYKGTLHNAELVVSHELTQNPGTYAEPLLTPGEYFVAIFEDYDQSYYMQYCMLQGLDFCLPPSHEIAQEWLSTSLDDLYAPPSWNMINFVVGEHIPSSAPTLSFATDTPEGLYEDDGIQDHKGTALQTHFTFSTIYTDATNRAPEQITLTMNSDDILVSVSAPLTPDTETASTTLKDGDYRNGELFSYYHPLALPKGAFTYAFNLLLDGVAATVPPSVPFSFKTGYSNVAFLPGLEASRLFRASTTPAEQIWDPPTIADNTELYLNPDGTSIHEDVVVLDGAPERAVLDEVYGVNVYKNFINFMKEEVVGSGVINEWEALPYDWRLNFPELLARGNKTGDHVSYLQSTSSPFILQQLKHLAQTSDTGKVTILTHSNGGLLAKYLLATLAQTHDPLEKKIDKVIMVAAPQLGTPKALAGLLHGDEANLGAGFILTKEEARTLGENMQSAYNLLPSNAYFSTVESPVVIFDESVRDIAIMSTLASTTITNASVLEYFLRGQGMAWAEPANSERDVPNVLKDPLLAKAKDVHTLIDGWTPPAGMSVIQIAGWGIDTVKSVRYSCGIFCNSLATLDRDIETTLDGDETVVTPSAVWMSTSTANVERWWVDLEKHNTIIRVNREHASILEVIELQNFIKSIFEGGRTVDGKILKAIRPTTTEVAKRLRFTMHSPESRFESEHFDIMNQ